MTGFRVVINDPDRIDQVVIVIMAKTEANSLPATTSEDGQRHNAAATPGSKPDPLPPAFNDEKHHLRIYQGACLEILAAIPEATVDLVFADPPYFVSNGGITCHAGRMVSVNKGEWDKSRGPNANHEFNRAWLAAC